MTTRPNLARPLIKPDEFQGQMLLVGNLKMHVVLAGQEGAPLVVLLHGFPEFWYSWRHQIRALAAAGFRVVAPDMRGYNLTEKLPPYDPFALAKDPVNLIRTLGYEKAYLIGHDWGGVVSWLTAAFYPEVIEKLMILNCPHPGVASDILSSFYLPQIAKSWYIFAFQLPRLPELLSSANNFRALEGGLKRGTPNGISKDELVYFKEAWSQPGALHAGITYYRELLRKGSALRRRDMTIRVPTRMIWGDPDFALTKEAAERSKKYAPHLEIDYIPNSGHFVQQDRPDEVNQLILAYLKGS
ncbi:MAG: epoxide hydrolase EphM [Anaerolineae bacterium]